MPVGHDREHLLGERRVAPLVDRASRVDHERVVVVQIVEREEPRAERLAAFEQVMQIGARMARARGARARRVERVVARRVGAARDPHAPRRRERRPLPREVRRQHAVENVDAGEHRVQQIGRRADPHQVARARRREMS